MLYQTAGYSKKKFRIKLIAEAYYVCYANYKLDNQKT